MLHMLHVEWCVVGSINTLMKAIAKGACDYWIMPLDENQIKNM
jgi:ActR/RegA family two-component response regulator